MKELEYKYTGNYNKITEEEWLIEDEGVKLNFSNCEAAELLVEFSDYELKAWIIVGDIEVLADAVAHTKKGAIGKTMQSSLTHCLIVDGKYPLTEQIELGESSPITDDQKASFDKFLEDYDSKLNCNINCGGKIKSDFLDDTKWKLILLSHKEVYIIAKKALVIAKGDDKEVFVRYSGDKENAHVFVEKGNVNVHTNKVDVTVGQDGNNFIINGTDIRELVSDMLLDVKESLSFNSGTNFANIGNNIDTFVNMGKNIKDLVNTGNNIKEFVEDIISRVEDTFSSEF